MNDILIVGLGNPGDRYANTRHNIGWMVSAKFAEKHKINIIKESNIYYSGRAKYAGKNIILCFPTTYMNLSGEAVKKISDKNNIPVQNILAVVDEYNFPLGKVHLKNTGTDGGHNGIASLIEEMNANNFYRLRMGIGKNFGQGELVDYVLSEFNSEEAEELKIAINKGVDALECVIKSGFQRAMSQINSEALWRPKEEKQRNDVKQIEKDEVNNG